MPKCFVSWEWEDKLESFFVLSTIYLEQLHFMWNILHGAMLATVPSEVRIRT